MYIALDQDASCIPCQTAGWACSIARHTPGDKPRSTDKLVGVRCEGCSAGGCKWPDDRQLLSLAEKRKLLDIWNADQPEIMERRKLWFQTGVRESAGERERSSSVRQTSRSRQPSQSGQTPTPQENTATISEDAGTGSQVDLGTIREERSDDNAGGEEKDNNGDDGFVWEGHDTVPQVEADQHAQGSTQPNPGIPEVLPTISRKRKLTEPPLDDYSSRPHTRSPSDQLKGAPTADSMGQIPPAMTTVSRVKKPKPASAIGKASDNLMLVSGHGLDEIDLDLDLPYFRIERPSPHLDGDGVHRSLKAYFSCPTASHMQHSRNVHPSVARMLPFLAREVDMKMGFVAQFSNLVKNHEEEYIDLDTMGRRRITLPPYVYSAKSHKCSRCTLKNMDCYFGYIPTPTPDAVITGSIPLGSCLACLSNGAACTTLQTITAEKFPLVKWFGPIRASFMGSDFGGGDHMVSPMTSRATTGFKKGELTDSGPLMMVSPIIGRRLTR